MWDLLNKVFKTNNTSKKEEIFLSELDEKLIFNEKKQHRFCYRDWNTFDEYSLMVIITEEDIRKGQIDKLSGGMSWNLLILPHKYQYVENQTKDIKNLFLKTRLNQWTRPSKIIFV